MKVVFFSDIHGNKYVMPPFLQAMEQEGADCIVFCGDVFGYYYYQNEIIDILREKKYITLLGNHDQYFLDILSGKANVNGLVRKYGNSYLNIRAKVTEVNTTFIKELKPFCELQLDGCHIGVFHGSPNDPLNGRVYPDTKVTVEETQPYEKYDCVILGHTHHKMDRRIKSTLVLNPGSIGQQRDGKGCSYLVLNTVTGQYDFKIIKYEVDRLIQDIEIYDPGNSRLKEVLLRNSG